MPRVARHPNTQTPADRVLERKIKRRMSAARKRKRKLYGLSSNREADLYIPRHFTPFGAAKQSEPRDKIIPFDRNQS
jgi:hypothetical protein